jgi:hypothetical protein
LEPSNRAKTKLAVCNAFVLIDPDGPIKDSLAAWEVVAVLANVFSSLRIVPGRHALIVATKNVFTKAAPRRAPQMAFVRPNV